jgi:hypothetical protein
VLAQPAPEGRAAGEVHDADRVMRRELGGDRRLRRVGRELHDIRREARLLQNGAGGADGDRQRQDRRRVRLDDHGIAGREAREQAGIAVPGREGGAADDQPMPRGTARKDLS